MTLWPANIDLLSSALLLYPHLLHLHFFRDNPCQAEAHEAELAGDTQNAGPAPPDPPGDPGHGAQRGQI